MERERYHISDSRPPPPDRSSHISERMPDLIKKLGLQNQLWETALTSDWESLVGPQVAKQTRPGRLQYKILHIFVSNSMWLSELSRYHQKTILENIQARFGKDKIDRIKLQIDPDTRN